jgi:hypothetical protein
VSPVEFSLPITGRAHPLEDCQYTFAVVPINSLIVNIFLHYLVVYTNGLFVSFFREKLVLLETCPTEYSKLFMQPAWISDCNNEEIAAFISRHTGKRNFAERPTEHEIQELKRNSTWSKYRKAATDSHLSIFYVRDFLDFWRKAKDDRQHEYHIADGLTHSFSRLFDNFPERGARILGRL